MKLEPRDRGPTRRNVSRDLVVPIIRALNRLPGVRVVRNANLGPVVPWGKRFDPNTRPIIAGLGAGSADVVGVENVVITQEMVGMTLGRALALEVKLPADRDAGLSAGALKPDQRRWLKVARRFGMYADVVHGVEEAIAAVEACRRGESGSTVL